jgi:hypothetical protein
MRSRGTQKRSRSLAAAAALALLGGLSLPVGALGTANPGGTAPGSTGTSGSGKHGTSKASKPSTHRRTPSVSLVDLRCVPASSCGSDTHMVSVHGTMLVSGRGLSSGMAVAFPRLRGARISRSSPHSHVHASARLGGLVVTVPGNAHSGEIRIELGGGRYSNAAGPIRVVRYALHPPKPPPAPVATLAGAPGGTAFEGQGMWIWYLEKSDGGNLASIAAQAHAAGVGTVLVKSADGSGNYWSQFSPALVQGLHALGVRVCAWQYVYGTEPIGEAEMGAAAVAAGADCLVIDAESEYEGRYGAAQRYIAALRAKIGPDYPLGLASFPYVDYHPAFPYSVFLGPGGAQFNAPQMYWKDIGTSVAQVFVHTWEENLIYGRPIFPLGQTYSHPSPEELVDFRSLAHAYGATGTSWWDWQETPSEGWAALAAALDPSLVVPTPELTSPLLGEGSKGDQVLWLQEHLASAIPTQTTSGILDAQTAQNLAAFQPAHGLPQSAQTAPSTWEALLALPPVAVDWTGGGP